MKRGTAGERRPSVYVLQATPGHELRSDLGPADFFPRLGSADAEVQLTGATIHHGYCAPAPTQPPAENEWGSLRDAAGRMGVWRARGALLRTVQQIACLRALPTAPGTVSAAAFSSSSLPLPSQQQQPQRIALMDPPRLVAMGKQRSDEFLRELAELDLPLAKLEVSHNFKNHTLVAGLGDAGVPLARAMWFTRVIYRNFALAKAVTQRPSVEFPQALVTFVAARLGQPASPSTFSLVWYAARLLAYVYHENLVDRVPFFSQLLGSALGLVQPQQIAVWAVFIQDYIPDILAATAPKVTKDLSSALLHMISKLDSLQSPLTQHLQDLLKDTIDALQPPKPLFSIASNGFRRVDVCSVSAVLDDFAAHFDATRAVAELAPQTPEAAAEIVQIVCGWAVTDTRSHFPIRDLAAGAILMKLLLRDETGTFPVREQLSQFLGTFVPRSDSERNAVALLFGNLIKQGLFTHGAFVRRLISHGLLEDKLHLFYFVSFPVPYEREALTAGQQNLGQQQNQRRAILESLGIPYTRPPVAEIRNCFAEIGKQVPGSPLPQSAQEFLEKLGEMPLHDRFALSDWAADMIFPQQKCFCSLASEQSAMLLCMCKPTADQFRFAVAVLERAANFVALVSLLLRAFQTPDLRERHEIAVEVAQTTRRHLHAFACLGFLRTLVGFLSNLAASPAQDSARVGMKLRIDLSAALRDAAVFNAGKTLFVHLSKNYSGIPEIAQELKDVQVPLAWRASQTVTAPDPPPLNPQLSDTLDAVVSAADGSGAHAAISQAAKDARSRANQLAPLVCAIIDRSSNAKSFQHLIDLVLELQTFQVAKYVSAPQVEEALLSAATTRFPLGVPQLELFLGLTSRGVLERDVFAEHILVPSLTACVTKSSSFDAVVAAHLSALITIAEAQPSASSACWRHVLCAFFQILKLCRSAEAAFQTLQNAEVGRFLALPVVGNLLFCSHYYQAHKVFFENSIPVEAQWLVIRSALLPFLGPEIEVPTELAERPLLELALRLAALHPTLCKWAFGAALFCAKLADTLKPDSGNLSLLSMQTIAGVAKEPEGPLVCQLLCSLSEMLGVQAQVRLLRVASAALEYNATEKQMLEGTCKSASVFAHNRLDESFRVETASQQYNPRASECAFGRVITKIVESMWRVQNTNPEVFFTAITAFQQSLIEQIQAAAAFSRKQALSLGETEVVQGGMSLRLRLLEVIVCSHMVQLKRAQLHNVISALVSVFSAPVVAIDMACISPAIARVLGALAQTPREGDDTETVPQIVKSELEKLPISLKLRLQYERLLAQEHALPVASGDRRFVPTMVALSLGPEALRITQWNLIEEFYDCSNLFPRRMPRCQLMYGPRMDPEAVRQMQMQAQAQAQAQHMQAASLLKRTISPAQLGVPLAKRPLLQQQQQQQQQSQQQLHTLMPPFSFNSLF